MGTISQRIAQWLERAENQSCLHVAADGQTNGSCGQLGTIRFSLEGLLVFTRLAPEDLFALTALSLTLPTLYLSVFVLLSADNWQGERRPRLPPQGDGFRTECVRLPGALLSTELSPCLLPHGCCVLWAWCRQTVRHIPPIHIKI